MVRSKSYSSGIAPFAIIPCFSTSEATCFINSSIGIIFPPHSSFREDVINIATCSRGVSFESHGNASWKMYLRPNLNFFSNLFSRVGHE